ncbi:hypothetical protein ABBQ32_000552 [Trebouxia sp. C0010 RCD-2024]
MGILRTIVDQPDEFSPLVQMAWAAHKAKRLPKDPNLAFCYDMLNRVSRSFAIVIQQLPAELRDPVCIFYLVLRALDTVEDDMAIDPSEKLPILHDFYQKIYDRQFKYQCGYGAYIRLMNQYPRVTDVFLRLNPKYQQVIADITRRMGDGMAKYIQQEVTTISDYDEYCHFVAGLVGVGLSQLFASSGLETADFANMEELSNHMGLFLQKTNIIRDFLEDIEEEPAPRMFWPKEIWGLYADSLADFKEPRNAKQAVQCLNHMVTNALRHAPMCLKYMEQVKNEQNFRFCAIPQVMAVGTLALCFNNHKVFTGVVKMRRGQVATFMLQVRTMKDVYQIFHQFATTISLKCEAADRELKPSGLNLSETWQASCNLQEMCAQGLGRSTADLIKSRQSQAVLAGRLMFVMVALLILIVAYLLKS